MRALFKTSNFQKQFQEKKTIHSEGPCVLTSVFMWPFSIFKHQGLGELAGLSNPGDLSFTLSKPELKKKMHQLMTAEGSRAEDQTLIS